MCFCQTLEVERTATTADVTGQARSLLTIRGSAVAVPPDPDLGRGIARTKPGGVPIQCLRPKTCTITVFDRDEALFTNLDRP